MTHCTQHKDCAGYVRDLVRRYYGKADGEKKPRRTHEEVVIAKESKARAVQARREFHERRRAARPKDAE